MGNKIKNKKSQEKRMEEGEGEKKATKNAVPLPFANAFAAT